MTLKELVHDYGLTMGEFYRLDPETQEKWRQIQQEKNRQEQIEKERWWKQYMVEHHSVSKKTTQK